MPRRVTASVNPPDPVRPDSGPNEQLNAPAITSVGYDAVTHAAVIDGTIDTSADTNVEIHVYASSACDPSGSGEGLSDVDFAPVTTDAGGHAEFHANAFLDNGTYITALARRFTRAPADATIIVSEFSACARAGGETIFADGFDG